MAAQSRYCAPGSGAVAGQDGSRVRPVLRGRDKILAPPPPVGTVIKVPTGYRFSRGGQGDLFGFCTLSNEGVWVAGVSGVAFVILGSQGFPDTPAAEWTLVVNGTMSPRAPGSPPPGVFATVSRTDLP